MEGEPLRRIPGENPLRALIQDLANLRRELLDTEGLGEEVGAGIEHPVVHDSVARIAGRVEHLEVRPLPERGPHCSNSPSHLLGFDQDILPI